MPVIRQTMMVSSVLFSFLFLLNDTFSSAFRGGRKIPVLKSNMCVDAMLSMKLAFGL